MTEKDDFIEKVEQSGGKEIVLTLERDGELLELAVTPENRTVLPLKVARPYHQHPVRLYINPDRTSHGDQFLVFNVLY